MPSGKLDFISISYFDRFNCETSKTFHNSAKHNFFMELFKSIQYTRQINIAK